MFNIIGNKDALLNLSHVYLLYESLLKDAKKIGYFDAYPKECYLAPFEVPPCKHILSIDADELLLYKPLNFFLLTNATATVGEINEFGFEIFNVKIEEQAISKLQQVVLENELLKKFYERISLMELARNIEVQQKAGLVHPLLSSSQTQPTQSFLQPTQPQTQPTKPIPLRIQQMNFLQQMPTQSFLQPAQPQIQPTKPVVKPVPLRIEQMNFLPQEALLQPAPSQTQPMQPPLQHAPSQIQPTTSQTLAKPRQIENAWPRLDERNWLSASQVTKSLGEFALRLTIANPNQAMIFIYLDPDHKIVVVDDFTTLEEDGIGPDGDRRFKTIHHKSLSRDKQYPLKLIVPYNISGNHFELAEIILAYRNHALQVTIYNHLNGNYLQLQQILYNKLNITTPETATIYEHSTREIIGNGDGRCGDAVIQIAEILALNKIPTYPELLEKLKSQDQELYWALSSMEEILFSDIWHYTRLLTIKNIKKLEQQDLSPAAQQNSVATPETSESAPKKTKAIPVNNLATQIRKAVKEKRNFKQELTQFCQETVGKNQDWQQLFRSITGMYGTKELPDFNELQELIKFCQETVGKDRDWYSLFRSITGMQSRKGLPNLYELQELIKFCQEVTAKSGNWYSLFKSITGMQSKKGLPDLYELQKLIQFCQEVTAESGNWYLLFKSITGMQRSKGLPDLYELQKLIKFCQEVTAKSGNWYLLFRSIAVMQGANELPNLYKLQELVQLCQETVGKNQDWQQLFKSIAGMQSTKGLPNLYELQELIQFCQEAIGKDKNWQLLFETISSMQAGKGLPSKATLELTTALFQYFDSDKNDIDPKFSLDKKELDDILALKQLLNKFLLLTDQDEIKQQKRNIFSYLQNNFKVENRMILQFIIPAKINQILGDVYQSEEIIKLLQDSEFGIEGAFNPADDEEESDYYIPQSILNLEESQPLMQNQEQQSLQLGRIL